jgi:hypothetical protein
MIMYVLFLFLFFGGCRESGSGLSGQDTPFPSNPLADLQTDDDAQIQKEGPEAAIEIAENLEPVWLGSMKIYEGGRSEQPLFLNDEQLKSLHENLLQGLNGQESYWEFVECGRENIQSPTNDRAHCDYLATKEWGARTLSLFFSIRDSGDGPRQYLTINRPLQRPLIMRSEPLKSNVILLMDSVIDESAENIGVVIVPSTEIFHRESAWVTSTLLGRFGPIKPQTAPLTLSDLSREYENMQHVKTSVSILVKGVEILLLFLSFKAALAPARKFTTAVSAFLKQGAKRETLFALSTSLASLILASGNLYASTYHLFNLDEYESENRFVQAAQFLAVISSLMSFSTLAVGRNLLKVSTGSWRFLHHKALAATHFPPGLKGQSLRFFKQATAKLADNVFSRQIHHFTSKLPFRSQMPRVAVEQMDALSFAALRTEISGAMVASGVSFAGNRIWHARVGRQSEQVSIGPVGGAVPCLNDADRLYATPEDYGCSYWENAGEIAYPVGNCFKYFQDLTKCRGEQIPSGFDPNVIEANAKSCLENYPVSSCLQPLHFCVLTNAEINQAFMNCTLRNGGHSCFIGACQGSD